MKRRADVAAIPDWRSDDKVVQAHRRLTELDDLIVQAGERLRNVHTNQVAGVEAELHRKELEVLAGRASDSELAAAQQRHLDARMAQAKEQIAYEDMQAEKAKLEASIPAIEKKAKRAAYDALRAKGLSLLYELQAALAKMAEVEGNYTALVQEAGSQFSQFDPHQPGYDPDFAPRAGFGIFTRTEMNGYRQDVLDLRGATDQFAYEIDRALQALDPDGKARPKAA